MFSKKISGPPGHAIHYYVTDPCGSKKVGGYRNLVGQPNYDAQKMPMTEGGENLKSA